MKKNIKEKLSFIVFVIGTFGASFVGQLFTSKTNYTWYNSLIKAPLTPPSWTFSVVWTVLYLLMATAAWIIWKRTSLFSKALCWYYAQLIINTLYMPLFFGLHLLLPSTLWIIFLLVVLAHTIQIFLKINRLAGLLLVPYFIWSCFALYLSAGLTFLN